MIKFFYYFFTILLSTFVYGQDLYFNTGKNFTTYNYFNSKGETNPNIKSSNGAFYEIGYVNYMNSCRCDLYRFYYSASITLNEYNAVGGDSVFAYSWNTQYIGAQATGYYTLFPDATVDLVPKIGFGMSYLLSGSQGIGGVYNSLGNQKEFSGIFFNPSMGLEGVYKWNNYVSLSFGYLLSKSLKLQSTTPEKLSFTTHQIQFGLHFKL